MNAKFESTEHIFYDAEVNSFVVVVYKKTLSLYEVSTWHENGVRNRFMMGHERVMSFLEKKVLEHLSIT